MANLSKQQISWQPIETAPKDGTVILACSAKDYPRTSACVVWDPVHQSWACAWDKWPLEELILTHWQQMPEPLT